MSASRARVTGSDFQSFDGGRFIERTTKIFPVLGQGFAFERPKDPTIQIDGETMTMIKMNDDSIPWKGIIAGQANKRAVFEFTTEQRTILQNGTGL